MFDNNQIYSFILTLVFCGLTACQNTTVIVPASKTIEPATVILITPSMANIVGNVGVNSNITATITVSAIQEDVTATPVLGLTSTSPATLVPAVASTPQPIPSPPIPLLQTTLNAIYIREGPNTCHNWIGFLERGKVALVLAANSDHSWYYVETENSILGWVFAGFVEPLDQELIINVPLITSVLPCPTLTSTNTPIPTNTLTDTPLPPPVTTPLPLPSPTLILTVTPTLDPTPTTRPYP